MQKVVKDRRNLIEQIRDKVIVLSSLMVVNARNRKGSYADLVFSGLNLVVRIAIYTSMYRIVFGSGDSESYVAAVWAIAIAQVIFGLNRPDPTLSIGEEIKEGTIAIHLLRPLNYIQYTLATYWGNSAPALFVNSVFCFSAAFLLVRSVPATGVELLLSVVVIALGVILVSLIATFFGVLGFWTEDTAGFHYISHKMALLFGGLIIPLTLLPDTVQNIVQYIPWTVAMARPGRLFSEFTYNEFFATLGLQLIFILSIYFLCIFISNRGIKKLNVAGG